MIVNKRRNKIEKEIYFKISEYFSNHEKYHLHIINATLTNEYSFVKIYYICDEEYRETYDKKLNQQEAKIAHDLFSNGSLRKIPKLKFMFDDSMNKQRDVDNLLDDIKNNEDL